jgi:hypothetical protein
MKPLQMHGSGNMHHVSMQFSLIYPSLYNVKNFIITDTYADRWYNLINFTLAQSQLTGSAVWWGYSDMPVLDEVTILGIQTPVKSVFVNQASKPFSYHTINKVSFMMPLLACKILVRKSD